MHQLYKAAPLNTWDFCWTLPFIEFAIGEDVLSFVSDLRCASKLHYLGLQPSVWLEYPSAEHIYQSIGRYKQVEMSVDAFS